MKKLKKWQIVVIVVIVVGVIGAASGGSSKKKDKESTEDVKTEEKENKTEEKEVTYKVGDIVVVGDVEYVVNSIESTTTIGSEYINKTAQNVYLLVDVSVKNNGNKALTVTSSYFKLKNGDKEFEADSGAAVYLPDNNIFLDKINPDASLNGKIVFDVTQETIDAQDLQLQVQTGAWGTEKGYIQLH